MQFVLLIRPMFFSLELCATIVLFRMTMVFTYICIFSQQFHWHSLRFLSFFVFPSVSEGDVFKSKINVFNRSLVFFVVHRQIINRKQRPRH